MSVRAELRSNPSPDTEKKVILGAFKKADNYKGRHFSIARSQPKNSNCQQLTFLAPTPEMLKEWKEKKDTVRYTHRYNALLTENKTQVLEWIKNLQGDEVLLCWEPYVRTNSERERHFCHRLILGRLIATHRPDLKVVVDDLRCSGCSELYTDILKVQLTRTAEVNRPVDSPGYQFLCGDCSEQEVKKVIDKGKSTVPSQGNGLMDVRVYTDGGSRSLWSPGQGKELDQNCRKNIGGYGVVMVSGEHRKEMSTLLGEGVTSFVTGVHHRYKQITNQAAELQAAIGGLKALTSPEKSNVTLITNSQYVIGWATGKYTKLAGSKNKDLIETLKEQIARCGEFDVQWVKGHAGDEKQKGQALSANNRCDALATQAIEGGQVEIPVSNNKVEDILPDDGGASMLRAAREIEKENAQTNSEWNPTCTACGKTIAGGIAHDKCTSSADYGGFHRIDRADFAVQGIYCESCGIVADDTMFTGRGEQYCDACFFNSIYPTL